ncbi:hypothetical protein BVY04_02870 [bacterium M21]|nr:hypothetical protein BVY04_02870 [bacterium M21]
MQEKWGLNEEVKCKVCASRNRVTAEQINTKQKCRSCQNEYIVPITSISAGLVQGDYWVQRKIGSGNVGETFLAKRVSDNTKVFLKVLCPSLTGDPQCVNNFMIEICRSHQVDNAHIVSAFETGKLHGHYYIATPFVNGECLDQRIERDGPLSEKEVLKVALKTARLLRHAWQDYSLVHRSLRPSNILLTETSDVYLLDMGNSKHLLAPPPTPLDRLNFQGTVADYVSPEQAQGITNIDCTSDIYSLGATLFYLLTGTKPYRGEDTTQVLEKHLRSKAPDATKRSKQVSAETAMLIRKMMAKDAGERIRTWHGVIKEIKGILKTMTHGVATAETLKTQLKHTTNPKAETLAMKPTSGLDSKVLIGGGAAALVAVFVIAAGAILMINQEPDKTTKGISRQAGAAAVAPEVRRVNPEAFASRIKWIVEKAERYPNWGHKCMARLDELRQQTDDPKQIKDIQAATKKVRRTLTPAESASAPHAP